MERTAPRRRGRKSVVMLPSADIMPISRLMRNRHGAGELSDPLRSAHQEKGPQGFLWTGSLFRNMLKVWLNR